MLRTKCKKQLLPISEIGEASYHYRLTDNYEQLYANKFSNLDETNSLKDRNYQNSLQKKQIN